MYSVVLAMALAGGAEAPDCNCLQNLCGCAGVRTGCVGGCLGGCHGVGGCLGGCHGVVRAGCGGGCVGVPVGGCAGGYVTGTVVVPPPPAKEMPGEKVPPPKEPKKTVVVPNTATIVVTLPADAKLSIDGYVSQQTSAVRRLVTPALQPGQVFSYTLVSETTENGQPVRQEQFVRVRAGEVTPVNFSTTTTPVSASR